MRAGAKIMVKAIRAVPVRTTGPMEGRGAAKKSIGVKIKTYRNSGVTVAIVGGRITEGSRVHLHLREYGTVERFWTKQTAAVFGNRAVRTRCCCFEFRRLAGKHQRTNRKGCKKVKLASRLMASLIVSTSGVPDSRPAGLRRNRFSKGRRCCFSCGACRSERYWNASWPQWGLCKWRESRMRSLKFSMKILRWRLGLLAACLLVASGSAARHTTRRRNKYIVVRYPTATQTIRTPRAIRRQSPQTKWTFRFGLAPARTQTPVPTPCVTLWTELPQPLLIWSFNAFSGAGPWIGKSKTQAARSN